MDGPRMYTVKEAAKLIGITTGRLLQRIRNGTCDHEEVKSPLMPTGYYYLVPDYEIERIRAEPKGRGRERTKEGARRPRPHFLSTADYAKKHGVSRQRVHQWIVDGRIKVTKEGAMYLIAKDEKPPEKKGPGGKEVGEKPAGYLTTREFAKQHKVTPGCVQLWIKEKRIAARKIGGAFFIPRSEHRPENKKVGRPKGSRNKH